VEANWVVALRCHLRSLRPRSGTGCQPSARDVIHEAPGGCWVLLYDDACGFCKWVTVSILRLDCRKRLRPLALQRPEAKELVGDLTDTQFMSSWHLVSPTGRRFSAGGAVPVLLRLLPCGRLAATGFARAPRLTDRSYRWVAENRSRLSRWVPRGAKRRAAERLTQYEIERSFPARQD
jgi:predicted DCC family thiol-disulfide oxidoreductase YuxK